MALNIAQTHTKFVIFCGKSQVSVPCFDCTGNRAVDIPMAGRKNCQDTTAENNQVPQKMSLLRPDLRAGSFSGTDVASSAKNGRRMNSEARGTSSRNIPIKPRKLKHSFKSHN